MILIGRRRLFALVAIVGAASAGAIVAAATDRAASSGSNTTPDVTRPNPPPPELTRLLAQERALVAGLAATIAGDPQRAVLLTNIHDDHLAHIQSIDAALGSAASTATADGLPSQPVATWSLAQLRDAEQLAQQAAAGASASLSGATAVVLASISACEAGHVVLLT
jgi:hypothetical protein